MNATPLRLQCHRGQQGLDDIFDAWQGLMGRIEQQSFYQDPRWFRAYMKAHPQLGERLTFSCVYRGQRLVAVFPTASTRNSTTGTVMADLPVGDELYMADCAIADGENGSAIYAFYRKSLKTITGRIWDVYRARNVLRDSQMGRAVLGLGGFFRTVLTQQRCAVIPIGDYPVMISKLTKNFRGNLRKAKNRIDRAGDVQFVVERSPERVRKMFEAFIDLEMSGWKGDPSKLRQAYTLPSAIGLNRSKRSFYTSIVEEFSASGSIEICSLLLDGKLIASQLCLLLNSTCFIMKITYDESASRYSPGHLLIDHTIQRYSEEGRIKQCNLITDFAWHKSWNPTYLEYVVFRDFNATLRGTLACLRSKLGAKRREYLGKDGNVPYRNAISK